MRVAALGDLGGGEVVVSDLGGVGAAVQEQCNGVSPYGPVKRALTSAPAAISTATFAGRLGDVSPGQSVSPWSSVRDYPR